MVGVSILLKVRVESQPECLLFFYCGHAYMQSVRFPAGAGGSVKKPSWAFVITHCR